MELFEHQKEGIKFLRDKKKAVLAHSMGLGKTVQAILARGEKATLVICPASLKINWSREIDMATDEGEWKAIVQSGPEMHLAPTLKWYIVNYDLLPKYLGQIRSLVNEGWIDTAIIDEAHYIKGKSKRATATLEAVEGIPRLYCLTGTPILNRPIELFNMLKAVGHPLGKARTTFAKRYCGGQMKTLVRDIVNGRSFFVDPSRSYAFRIQKDKYRVFTFLDDTGATHIDELKRFTADVILRREKKDVLDLPEKLVSTQLCELGKEAKREYETAWETYLEWIERNPDASRNVENIKSAQQLVELMKLKQVCSNAKVARIVDDIENAVEQDEKVIVFSQFRNTILRLSNDLKLNGIEYVTLTGDNTTEERQQAVDDFQTKPEIKVFLANIKAGGVGINLTAASIVMFADFDWSPEVNRQCEDRAHRIGQTGTVNVYYYVCEDTVEIDIMNLLEQKSELIGHILAK